MSVAQIVFGEAMAVTVCIVMLAHGIQLNKQNVNGVRIGIGYCTIQQINMGIVISVQMG